MPTKAKQLKQKSKQLLQVTRHTSLQVSSPNNTNNHDENDDFEDLDTFWSSARPAPAVTTTNTTTTTTRSTDQKKKQRNPNDHNEEEEEKEWEMKSPSFSIASTSTTATPASIVTRGASWMERQLQQMSSSSKLLSPSNLSHVSTAPPTPHSPPDPPEEQQSLPTPPQQQQHQQLQETVAKQQQQQQQQLNSIMEESPTNENELIPNNTTTTNNNAAAAAAADDDDDDDDDSDLVEQPPAEDDFDDLFPSQASVASDRRDTLDFASNVLPPPPEDEETPITQEEEEDMQEQDEEEESPPSLENSMEDLIRSITTNEQEQTLVQQQQQQQKSSNEPIQLIEQEDGLEAEGEIDNQEKDHELEQQENEEKMEKSVTFSKTNDDIENDHIIDNNNNNDIDDDDDDDDDGPGFQMTSPMDQKSTSSSEASTTKITIVPPIRTPVKTPPPRRTKQGVKKNKTKKKPAVATPDTPSNKYSSVPAGNRDYQTIANTNFTTEDNEEDGLRRSRRAKFPPLQFWKNERVVYQPHEEHGRLGDVMGDMPVVSGIMQALPTPYKPKRPKKRKVIADTSSDEEEVEGRRTKKKKAKSSLETTARPTTPFDSRKLRKQYKINDGEVAYVWDEGEGEIAEDKIFCYSDNMVGSDLPLSSKRGKRESKKVGKAAQSFNVAASADNVLPGFIAGNLRLPPKAIKDAEGVGLCAQVFNVSQCQPKSLEVAIADPEENGGKFSDKSAQRFLLSPGDMFHIPPGNIYRLQNHSNHEESLLFWTIVRPCKPT